MRFHPPRRPWLALVWAVTGCLPADPGLPLAPARAIADLVRPGLDVSVGERFYDVSGMTARTVNLELTKNGPRHEGAIWQGLTHFRVHYRYQPRPWGEGCRAVDARVSVDVVTTLPRWEERAAAPDGLRWDWDLFITRLREHERGHQRIAIVTGRELLEQVEALRAPDCVALRRHAKKLAEAFQTTVELEQKSFDLESDHGSQGGS